LSNTNNKFDFTLETRVAKGTGTVHARYLCLFFKGEGIVVWGHAGEGTEFSLAVFGVSFIVTIKIAVVVMGATSSKASNRNDLMMDGWMDGWDDTNYLEWRQKAHDPKQNVPSLFAGLFGPAVGKKAVTSECEVRREESQKAVTSE
jgi:hypothetical protein